MSSDLAPAAHKLPDGWQMVHDYADHGGPKPGYEKSRRIFDEYLQLLDYDRCSHPDTRHLYILRRPGITIPAAGYDHGEYGTAFLGKWRYGNAWQYREADHMKLVPKSGVSLPGPKALWGFYGYGFQNMPSGLEDLALALREGEFVHYTVRDVRSGCRVILRLRCKEKGSLSVSCNESEYLLDLKPSGSVQEVRTILLPAGDEYAVRIEATEGEILLEEIEFACEKKCR